MMLVPTRTILEATRTNYPTGSTLWVQKLPNEKRFTAALASEGRGFHIALRHASASARLFRIDASEASERPRSATRPEGVTQKR